MKTCNQFISLLDMIEIGMEWCRLGSLTFKTPDNVKYPSMDLAYAAGRAGGTMTGVLSAANEKAVEMFIDEKYVIIPVLARLHLIGILIPHQDQGTENAFIVLCLLHEHFHTRMHIHFMSFHNRWELIW